MKRISLASVALLLALFITSCDSNPLDRKYSDNKFVTDVKDIRESNKLSEEEMKMLAGYVINAKFTGEKIESMTYGEMVKKAKEMAK